MRASCACAAPVSRSSSSGSAWRCCRPVAPPLVGLGAAVLPAGGAARAQGPVAETYARDLTATPASADWVDAAIDDAKDDGAYMAIFELDTPGGLDDSMREIVKDIIGAP